MTPWELPTSLNIGGVEYPIRTDFRAILDILQCLSSPEYEDDEKQMIFFIILFPEFEAIPPELYEEAAEKASEFIDMGISDRDKRKPTTMNWEKDAPIIIPAVNRVIGTDVRTIPYDAKKNTGGLHWWTFLGAYMEIGESLFSSVLNIRQKRAKGKKLEKYEQEFYRENKRLIDLESTKTQRSKEEQEALAALLG